MIIIVYIGKPGKCCFENAPIESQKKHIAFDMDCQTFFKSACEGAFFLAKL